MTARRKAGAADARKLLLAERTYKTAKNTFDKPASERAGYTGRNFAPRYENSIAKIGARKKEYLQNGGYSKNRYFIVTFPLLIEN